jgi:uncharacterized protein (DUF924 family)
MGSFDMAKSGTIERVLDFWFGRGWETGEIEPEPKWFKKDPIFDDSVKEWFSGMHAQASEGRMDGWMDEAVSALALVIVLDQFPRNMYRGEAAAFKTDGRALMWAAQAVDLGFDDQVPPVMRQFFYFPFEHSEDSQNQAYAVRLFKQFENHPTMARTYEFALRHQAVIDRFGRFPHRNAALGRASTMEEVAFLQEPGSGF